MRDGSSYEALRVLGKNLRLARVRCDLSQEQLGLEAGLHRTHVSQIERGLLNVSVLNLVKLANALDTTAGQLLEGVALQS